MVLRCVHAVDIGDSGAWVVVEAAVGNNILHTIGNKDFPPVLRASLFNLEASWDSCCFSVTFHTCGPCFQNPGGGEPASLAS